MRRSVNTLGRLWFVSELYYPEETSTGYYVTKIAEGLASDYDVGALCGQPTYARRGTIAPRHELRNGVHIWRVLATTFDKNTVPLRAINLATISLSLGAAAWSKVRRGDIVVVTTNPPALPYAVAVAARLRGANCVLLVHDVYPEVFVAAGVLSSQGIAVRAIRILQRMLYRSMYRIIVIGRDMQRLISTQLGSLRGAIVLITNWADVDDIRPLPRADNGLLTNLGIAEKFVVQYSGNMGRTHGLDVLLDAAERLRTDPSIRFLFIGGGAQRRWLETTTARRGLASVTFLPYQPRQDLCVSLNACDVAVISLARGMAGVSVPSRMYNVMASGKPIIAVTDENSELAYVVREEQIGWVIPPDAPDDLANAIREALGDRTRLNEMGNRARKAAVQKYSREMVLNEYRQTLAPRGRE